MKTKYIVKSSGKKEEFKTGSVRDSQEGKPRYDLIPISSLKRVANHYTYGAAKYSDNNWMLGQPLSRVYASLFRHVIAWREGDVSEDHLAAVCFNAMALMYFQDNKPELDDLFNNIKEKDDENRINCNSKK